MTATLTNIDAFETQTIPADVAMVISAIEAGTDNQQDRRAVERVPYRVAANLKLFTDQQPTPPWLLYIRDINTRSLGFVTSHRLPLGYGGIIELARPNGDILSAHCTLLRCRQAAPGWFEGCLYFNREQAIFE